MRDDGAFMVGSKRVVFMHFSGISDFASYNIEAVSKHQNRFTMSDFPDLRERTVHSKLVARVAHSSFLSPSQVPCS